MDIKPLINSKVDALRSHTVTYTAEYRHLHVNLSLYHCLSCELRRETRELPLTFACTSFNLLGIVLQVFHSLLIFFRIRYHRNLLFSTSECFLSIYHLITLRLLRTLCSSKFSIHLSLIKYSN